MSLEPYINKVIHGDCREVMKNFPDESVDLCMFSPPYFGLRNYGEETETIWGGDSNCEHEWSEFIRKGMSGGTKSPKVHVKGKEGFQTFPDSLQGYCVKCGAWRGQLGLEPDWRMYVQHMVEVCREIKRVLKKTGSMYIVLGDTYACKSMNWTEEWANKPQWHPKEPIKRDIEGYQPKCLMGIPWRVAFALIEDGWILRNDIIWHKPNAMPSSVRDRLAQTYEHIFHFVKNRKYYYDLDSIREPHKTGSVKRAGKGGISAFGDSKASKQDLDNYILPESRRRDLIEKVYRIVKEIRGKPYDGKSMEVKGWKEACSNVRAYRQALKILEQQETLTNEEKEFLQDYTHNHPSHPLGKNPGDVVITKHDLAVARIGNFSYTDPLHVRAYHEKGKNPGDFWSICTRPFKGSHYATYPIELCLKPILSSSPPNGIVLDPMCGSGTTLLAALKLGRRFIGIDIKEEYVRMARERLSAIPTRLDAYLE